MAPGRRLNGMSRPRVYALFFLSGICGLVYEVLWVRQFGTVFGCSVHSAALVSAIYMLGLGLGGFLAGRFADRKYLEDPDCLVRYYGYLELGVGLYGLAIAVLLPALEPLSGMLSSYRLDERGWHVLSVASDAMRYAMAALMLLPLTTLMGGTLTLLVRHLVRSDLSITGQRIGALYGINTAGAALGAFLVDYLLVPNLGVFAALSLAVTLNLAVGLAALRWARKQDRLEAPESQVQTGSPPARATLALALTAVAIMLSGFGAMGMEILWFRYLITFLGERREIFSLLLTVILTGIWWGSMAGGWLHRRLGNAALLFAAVQAAFIVSTVGLFMAFDVSLFDRAELARAVAGTAEPARNILELGAALRVIVAVAGLPSFFMGFSFPLANAVIQTAESSVGSRAGSLYLANTAGAVAGALVTGFALLPGLGMQTSVLVLASCSALAILPLSSIVFGAGPTASFRTRLAATVCAVMATAAIGAWARLPERDLATRTYTPMSKQERLLAFSEGINESIVVTETPSTGARRLYTNGHSMSTTNLSAQRYMRAFVHLPLLQLDRPKRTLVICFGVGNTLHAATLHRSLETIEVVDLSRQILEHAGFFARWNKGALANPRVQVFVNDGRQHLRMQDDGSYDLVTLEPPPLSHAGIGALYSEEFYDLARRKLRHGGYLTQWLPAYQVPGPVTRAMVRAFLDVFPDGILLSGNGSELILMGRNGLAPKIDPATVRAALAREPEVAADMAAIEMGRMTEIVGTFAGSSVTLDLATRDVAPMSDDLPVMEYCGALVRRTIIPEDIFSPKDVISWCPACFDASGRPGAGLQDLPEYLALMGALYASAEFRVWPPTPLREDAYRAIAADPLLLHRAWEASSYLKRILPEPPSGS